MAISEETRRKLSEASKANWKNPGFRERVMRAITSDEIRQKSSDAHKAMWQDPEYREKVCNSMRGKSLSAEHREKISHFFKGRKQSAEHREKISRAQKGSKRSPETRRKMSEAAKARCADPEWRKKNSNTSKARWADEEFRQKYSTLRTGKPTSMIGHTHPPDVREKISKAQKKAWSDPEYRKKQRDLQKAVWDDPDYRAENVGPNHFNWKGGLSYEPYCPKFNREFKERVREFFGRVCVECGVPETGRKLCVHHVNFRKDSCCDPSVIPLFVPLCLSCHAKTNLNREYWEDRFTRLINDHYGGRCYLPKKG